MGWWVAEYWQLNPALLISWVVWIFVSIILHELAHGVAAIRCGDRTPIELGHMTLNPVVHMSPQSLIVFAVIGITWGSMPVNPSRFRGRHDDAIVSFAGPALNILLAILCIIGCAIWIRVAGGVSQPLQGNIEVFLATGAGINAMLTLLNLLPIPPLDGSRILASFSWQFREFMYKPESARIGLIALVVIFISGIGDAIFGFAFSSADQAIDVLVGALGGVESPR